MACKDKFGLGLGGKKKKKNFVVTHVIQYQVLQGMNFVTVLIFAERLVIRPPFGISVEFIANGNLQLSFLKFTLIVS